MSEPPTFEELMRGSGAGDHAAAAELVRSYEPAIRRAIRFRLSDARLGHLLDSMDISQSVLGSFFYRAASGQYDLQSPEQLLSLLADMARKKLISQARKQRSQRRGGGRVVSGAQDERCFVAPNETPSAQVAAVDLLQQVRNRMSPEERQILELRNQGHDWATIAAQLGGGSEALRKKLARAINRVATELGLDGVP